MGKNFKLDVASIENVGIICSKVTITFDLKNLSLRTLRNAQKTLTRKKFMMEEFKLKKLKR